MKKLFILTASLVASLAVTATAEAQIIVNGGTAYGGTADITPVGTGLYQQVIHLSGYPNNNDPAPGYQQPPLIGDATSESALNTVASFVASYNPSNPPNTNTSYTFLNTNTAFQYSGGSAPTNAFLGADATGAAATDSTSIVGTIMNATGYIDVQDAGDSFTFTFASADDSARLSLGGQTVIEQNYFNGAGLDSPSTADVTFAAAGYYSLDLLYTQNGGGGGLSYSVTPDLGDNGSFTYAVAAAPEPSTWALLLGGVTALVVINRRRSVKV